NTSVCFRKYDRPTPVNGTTLDVIVTLSLIDLNSISLLDMDYRLDYNIMYEWTTAKNVCEIYVKQLKDNNLIVDAMEPGELLELEGDNANMFWIPETCIEEAKKVEISSSFGNKMFLTLTITPEFACNLKYKSRLAALIGCQMDFRDYPFDRQLCNVRLRSRTNNFLDFFKPKDLFFKADFYSLPLVNYLWNPSGVTFQFDLHLNNYDVNFSWNSFDAIAKGANFSYLEVDFVFQRKLSHFFVQVILPTLIIVTVSYSSFWISVDTGSCRFTLTVTTFLSLVAQFAGLKSQLPPVSYITALDIWMLACMFAVFAAIIEVTVANYYDEKMRRIIERRKREADKKRKLLEHRSARRNEDHFCIHQIKPIDANFEGETSECKNRNNDRVDSSDEPLPDMAVKVDKIFRAFIPLAFLAFNLVYWPLLLTQKLL
ncbi:glycine receptor subunit alpha-2-like protein, partial [Dinothrombium tinctorium]